MSEENANQEVESQEEVVAEQGEKAERTTQEFEDVVSKMVEERLSKMKSNMDRMSSERDEAVRKAVQLEEAQKEAKMKSLEEEGKHKEVAEMKLAALEERLKIAEERNIRLSRDQAVKDTLSSLDFRNERSYKMAFKDIVENLVQDENGSWVHKTGAGIRDFVSTYAKDEDNEFLFKPKNNSGGGISATQGTPNTMTKKRFSEMTTQEAIAFAAKQQKNEFNF